MTALKHLPLLLALLGCGPHVPPVEPPRWCADLTPQFDSGRLPDDCIGWSYWRDQDGECFTCWLWYQGPHAPIACRTLGYEPENETRPEGDGGVP